ncbi:MAG: PF20097 family protein, partial [Candidatus Bathyarchaeales archaeon]
MEKGRGKLETAEEAERKVLVDVCPMCGSEMEKGYIASRMIAWSNKKISIWSFKGLWSGEI